MGEAREAVPAARGRAWLMRATTIKLTLLTEVSSVLLWVYADLLTR